MLGMDCEDDSCLANIGGICTAGKGEECEGYSISDEECDDEYFFHQSTQEMVCPYCGHVQDGAFEWMPENFEGSGEYECDQCEKTFMATREFGVRYTTEKIKEEHHE